MLSVLENVFFVWIMGGRGQVGTLKLMPELVKANFLTEYKSPRKRNLLGTEYKGPLAEIYADPQWNKL